MNFLAHCLLSCSDEDIMLGNFITDFLSLKEERSYSGKVRQGILLHKEIDSFTDAHTCSLELRKMLRPRHGKYASVVVDLIWDHCLCLSWQEHGLDKLREYCQAKYIQILSRKSELPLRLKNRIDAMVADDFLMSYSDLERMRKALIWMDQRVKFRSDFEGAILDFQENQEQIMSLFQAFFPELTGSVNKQCNLLNLRNEGR